MASEAFTLKSRDEVLRFEELLEQYVTARSHFAPNHLSLATVYDQLQGREDGGKIFTALLDIQINFMILHLDMSAVGGTWNSTFSKGKLEGGSVLDSADKFFGKMEIHRFNTSFVLRYRAIWDKLMGLMVMIFCPKDYEAFASAKSRKKAFAKIAEREKWGEGEFHKSIATLLTKFDDTFRTPEAHGTGALRKYSFTMDSLLQNPQGELVGYWNAVNGFISNLGKAFNSNIDKQSERVTDKPASV
jgi:hypothetical protein